MKNELGVKRADPTGEFVSLSSVRRHCAVVMSQRRLMLAQQNLRDSSFIVWAG